MDRYQRIKKIGEGSFGKALLVRSKENGRQFVVKEINMVKMGKKERDEARKETAVLAQLQHPNIVTYRESFEEIGNLYIVMDYCEGGDLYGKINAQRGVMFQEDLVMDWFVQICLAIKHIHDRKILHRDIKSQNIFITKHGIIKLGDFGIAKVLNSTVELARTCIGTPYYLSPEICENKPYNNKSDVWSLGCVLYELTTLKHAFEAGNMKNLVLKIIRGSYPPVPSRYSYEMRSLIAQLFKRSPRDRPSINAVLRKSILQNRIRKFLTDSELAEEFSHTILHGRNLKKALPPGQNRPQPVRAQAPRPVAAKKPPSTPRYDPASVYAPSLARKSRDKENRGVRKSSDTPRRSSDGNKKAPHVVNHPPSDLQRRRQELVEKERQRREAAKFKDVKYAAAHKELVEKQKQMRMQKAREEGWRCLLSDDNDVPKRAPTPQKNIEPKKVVPSPKPSGQPAVKNKGNYDEYHAWLREREERNSADVQAHGAPPVAGFNPSHAARQGEAAGARGAAAADKARVLEEYLARKREAALNKVRAQGAGAPGMARKPVVSPAMKPPCGAQAPTSAREAHRRQSEQDYLQRLKQIRLHNFNERRNLRENMQQRADAKYRPGVEDENEVRRKKIEALRAQADERAQRLKAELEKKRGEGIDARPAARHRLPEHRAVRAEPAPAPKPAPVFPMTEAMKAIGAAKDPVPAKPAIGMTAAMEAIGASRTPRQQQKDSILKRLNNRASQETFEKPSDPAAPVAAAAAAPAPAPAAARPKWGEPVRQMAQERPKWESGGSPGLGELALEETSSHMDATSAADQVVRHLAPGDGVGAKEDEPLTPGRRQWAAPSGTVVRALAERELSSGGESTMGVPSAGTTAVEGAGSESAAGTDEPAKEPASNHKAPAIGSTITIVRNPANGTVVIKKATPGGDSAEAGTDVVLPSVDYPEKSEAVDEKATDDSDIALPPPGAIDGVELEDLEDLEDGEQGGDEGDGGTQQVEEAVPEKSDNFQESKQLLLGLTSGQFDMRNVKMLRTCSEPDLSKLFKTLAKVGTLQKSAELSASTGALDREEELDDEEEIVADQEEIVESTSKDGNEEEAKSDGELELPEDLSEGEVLPEATPEHKLDTLLEEGTITSTVDEDMDKDEARSSGPSETSRSDGSKSEPQDEEEEDDDDDEGDLEDDDDDLETLRESMMSLLANDDPVEDEEETAKPKKKTKKIAKKPKTKKKIKTVTKVNDEGEGDAPCSAGRQLSGESTGELELQTIRETMRSILNKDKPKPAIIEERPVQTGAGDATTEAEVRVEAKVEAKVEGTLMENTETWDSDSNPDDDDDDYFEEDGMFSRLEETRVSLEVELGCDTFLKAYKTVQAIHEDEDEGMVEGMQLVSQILGDGKQHLYPSILQLVMADGAFLEDND